jgi:type I restriction enzyme S subunit
MEQLMKQMETVKSDGGMHWEMVKLSEVCDVLGGYAFKSENFKNEGIPLLRISNIIDGEVSFKEDCVCVEDSNLSILQRFKVIKGDILLALSGATTGKFGVYKLNDFSFLNQRVGLIRAKDKTDPKYLLYYLNILKSQIEQIAQGAAQPNISTNEIGNLQIPLPPLPIQKRIAEILDAADALKRKDQELLKKYDELAQAIFIDMFGDPVKNEKGWEVKTIGESIDFMTSGSRGWAQYYSENGDLFLRINNVGYNEMKLQDLIHVTAPNNAEAIRTEIKSGDILLSITADLGRTCVIPDNFPKAFINQHLAILRLKKEYEPAFVSQVLSSEFGKLQFKKLNKGGVKAGLNFDDIKSLEFINPPIKYQAKYKKMLEEVLKQADKIIAINKKSNNLFQTLIQKAFKGELVK